MEALFLGVSDAVPRCILRVVVMNNMRLQEIIKRKAGELLALIKKEYHL